MISMTAQEATDLLNKWKDEATWLAVHATSTKTERHDFWAKVHAVIPEVVLAGEFAVLSLPMTGIDSFAYLDAREIPEEIAERIAGGMEFCFSIRSGSMVVFLFGAKSESE